MCAGVSLSGMMATLRFSSMMAALCLSRMMITLRLSSMMVTLRLSRMMIALRLSSVMAALRLSGMLTTLRLRVVGFLRSSLLLSSLRMRMTMSARMLLRSGCRLSSPSLQRNRVTNLDMRLIGGTSQATRHVYSVCRKNDRLCCRQTFVGQCLDGRLGGIVKSAAFHGQIETSKVLHLAEGFLGAKVCHAAQDHRGH